ncbi:MAG: tRNA (adenosine(37)-N6)-threonylcarbamoyltransferase complex dimerization subunit type 1 TsaB [Cognatishimia sp.]
MSDPLILAFDTSAAHCAAALLRGDEILASKVVEMSRGQAEELMPLLETLLTDQGHSWNDLSAIGVGIGPGNFTGIRISVSAARGLSLALNIPAIGVSTFDATRWGHSSNCVATVPAPRDHIYVLDQASGKAPHLTPAPYKSEREILSPPTGDILASNIARCASARLGADNPRPAPLYIRSADAAPARDQPPKIL